MSGITPIVGGSLPLPMIDGTASAGASSGTGAAQGFGDMLKAQLENLNSSQAVADTEATGIATGTSDDIARSMMRIEQANVSLQMATQVRNKVVEAYQEILRMQV